MMEHQGSRRETCNWPHWPRELPRQGGAAGFIENLLTRFVTSAEGTVTSRPTANPRRNCASVSRAGRRVT